MHASIFDDPKNIDFIAKRIRALQGQRGLLPCNARAGQSSAACWCFEADENGKTIPCPPPS